MLLMAGVVFESCHPDGVFVNRINNTHECVPLPFACSDLHQSCAGPWFCGAYYNPFVLVRNLVYYYRLISKIDASMNEESTQSKFYGRLCKSAIVSETNMAATARQAALFTRRGSSVVVLHRWSSSRVGHRCTHRRTRSHHHPQRQFHTVSQGTSLVYLVFFI